MNPIKFILTNRVVLAFIAAIAVDVICMGIEPWLYLLVIVASLGFFAVTWSIVCEGEKQSRSEEILLEWLESKFS